MEVITNKYLNDMNNEIDAFEKFENEVRSDLKEIDLIVQKLKNLAKDYHGYDLTADLEDMINDVM